MEAFVGAVFVVGLILFFVVRDSGPPKVTTPGEQEQRDYWSGRASAADAALLRAESEVAEYRRALVQARADIDELEQEIDDLRRAPRREAASARAHQIDELEAELRRHRTMCAEAVGTAHMLATAGRRALDDHQADVTRVNELALPNLRLNGASIVNRRDEIERLERSLPDR